jgi:hypothetical protein
MIFKIRDFSVINKHSVWIRLHRDALTPKVSKNQCFGVYVRTGSYWDNKILVVV